VRIDGNGIGLVYGCELWLCVGQDGCKAAVCAVDMKPEIELSRDSCQSGERINGACANCATRNGRSPAARSAVICFRKASGFMRCAASEGIQRMALVPRPAMSAAF